MIGTRFPIYGCCQYNSKKEIKLKKITRKKILSVFVIFISVCSFMAGCKNKIDSKLAPEFVNPNAVGLNKDIKDFLLSGNPGVLVLGTGLCANCIIVKDIVNKLKETRKDLGISWFVYEDYRDRASFQVFNMSISPTTYLLSVDNQILKRMIGTYTEQDLLDNLKETGLIH